MNRTYAIIIAIIAAIYILSPIDFIPDIVPIIGWIDDVCVLFGALYFIFRR